MDPKSLPADQPLKPPWTSQDLSHWRPPQNPTFDLLNATISQLWRDFDLGRNIQKLRNRRIYVIKSGSQESPSGSTFETTLDLSGPEPLETTQNPTLIY